MPFLRPNQPIRRFAVSLLAGVICLASFWLLWVMPRGEAEALHANHSTQAIGLFHPLDRHDRWIMEPESIDGGQIGLPRYQPAPGLTLTILSSILMVTLAIVLCHVMNRTAKSPTKEAHS